MSNVSFAQSFTFEGCRVSARTIEEFGCAWLLEIDSVWNINVTCPLSSLSTDC